MCVWRRAVRPDRQTLQGQTLSVPVDLAMQPNTTGSGSVTAVLNGRTLTITGTFEGLRGPATIAQVHKGPVTGVRGPVLFDLTVTKATRGTINGSFDLTPIQQAPRQAAPVRAASQRKSAGREPLGLAPCAGEQPMTDSTMRQSLVAGAGVLALGVALAGQQTPSAVYSAEQAAAGRAAYQASCASCHMPDLAGRSEAPPLAGPNFLNSWRSRATRDLFEFIQSTMPPDGSNLPADQYLAIAAFILES